MVEPLKLVSEPKKKETLVGRVEKLDELVDELIEANEDLKEELEQIRLGLGMSHVDFASFKDNGYRITAGMGGEAMVILEKSIDKLKKILGYQ